jgi:hypothetical protein
MPREVTKHVFAEAGGAFLRTEMAVPECGEDFCDACGDCLYCYWNALLGRVRGGS